MSSLGYGEKRFLKRVMELENSIPGKGSISLSTRSTPRKVKPKADVHGEHVKFDSSSTRVGGVETLVRDWVGEDFKQAERKGPVASCCTMSILRSKSEYQRVSFVTKRWHNAL